MSTIRSLRAIRRQIIAIARTFGRVGEHDAAQRVYASVGVRYSPPPDIDQTWADSQW